jgi:hypothetical protein
MRPSKLLLLVFFLPIAGWSQIYVSTNGSDLNDGSKSKPFATVAMALRKARDLRRLNDPSIKEGISIFVGEGIYHFAEPLLIRPEDSGTPESPTSIDGKGWGKTIFSGGFEIHGWRKLKETIPGVGKIVQEKIWVADYPKEIPFVSFRQLWVNDVKAIRAKSVNGNKMDRILSWDHQSQTCWIPNPPKIDLKNISGAEIFIQQWWAIAILRIKSMKVAGDSVQLSFMQPESRIQSEHPWPAPWISKKTGNSAFYLVNAIQFLDEPGEWYLDQQQKKIYYYPRDNENMQTANIVAPLLETIVKVEGTIDHPVSNFSFGGISFQHTGWLRPSQFGHVPLQAGMYLLDAYKLKTPGTSDKAGLENQAWIGRPEAAIEVSYADSLMVLGCRFEHLASTGLDLKRGTHGSIVQASVFKDVGGSGILAGVFSDESVETHLPYNPKDEREICTGDMILSNIVTDVGNEDWGCVGIGAGYVRKILIDRNEISDVPYTGISLGWGWTKSPNAMRENSVAENKIHHYAKHLYDVAAIYTLSAQPGTLIAANYIDSIYKAPYPHDPNHWFYIYTDEGSSGITVQDNWCPAEKFLQNANGPGNVWTNNGPMVSDEIKESGGPSESWFSIVGKAATVDSTWPVNFVERGSQYAASNKPFVFEVIGKTDAVELQKIFQQNGIASDDTYQWKDHVVAFKRIDDTIALKQQIAAQFPSVKTRIYTDMFYVFDRSKCGDKKSSYEWENILLTANLVSDPRLQKEYLDYHANQSKDWPEVAKGFCNADFQQLLVYRNGRQLMLVISIPKGKTLDELNPKTTENNPKMDQWNAIMKKYQEGIEGTRSGEVWVFLKKVNQE